MKKSKKFHNTHTNRIFFIPLMIFKDDKIDWNEWKPKKKMNENQNATYKI